MVNFDFLDRRGAERFAELLDETTGDHRHRSHAMADERLTELVAIGRSLAGARTAVRVEPEFRTGLRSMLVATAERDGIGRAVASEAQPTENAVVQAGRGVFGKGSGRRIRARGAIVIGVAAGALAVSGISAASENAAPGDALYGVKRSTERAQLAMAGSDLTRGQLSLDFARNRLAEAGALAGDTTKFGKVLNEMDNDTKQGVRLLTGLAVARRDKAPLAVVDTFVGAQRARLTPVLDGLNATARQRVVDSLSLLEAVHRRADDLRAGLACVTPASAGTDTLGPKLAACLRGSDTAPTPQHEPGTGQKQRSKPEESTRKAKPEQTGVVVAPSPSVTAEKKAPKSLPPNEAALPPQSEEPTELSGPADDDGQDSLLNSILDGGRRHDY